METVRIRDPGWKEVGSGIRDKHPGSATLRKNMPFWCEILLVKNVLQVFLSIQKQRQLKKGNEIFDYRKYSTHRLWFKFDLHFIWSDPCSSCKPLVFSPCGVFCIKPDGFCALFCCWWWELVDRKRGNLARVVAVLEYGVSAYLLICLSGWVDSFLHDCQVCLLA